MAKVIAVDFAGTGNGMTNPRKQAMPPDTSNEAQKSNAQNRTIRLGDDVWETWRLWCRVHKVTYEGSLVFLIEQHPITAEQLRETYPLLSRETKR